MSKASKEQASFEKNYLFLEKLSQELQENQVSVDELVPKMKEALKAIKLCKGVLKETKSQLKEINEEFIDLNSDDEDA